MNLELNFFECFLPWNLINGEIIFRSYNIFSNTNKKTVEIISIIQNVYFSFKINLIFLLKKNKESGRKKGMR